MGASNRVIGAAFRLYLAFIASEIPGLSAEESEASDRAGELTTVAATCTPSPALLVVGGLLSWQHSESVWTGRCLRQPALRDRDRRSMEQWMSRPL